MSNDKDLFAAPSEQELNDVFTAAPTADELADVNPEEKQITKGESLLRGAEQGASFGFSDELAGGIGGVLEMLPGSSRSQDEELRALGFQLPASASYTSIRNEDRAANAAAQEANPMTYLGGSVIGGAIAAPALGLTSVAGATPAAMIGNAALQGARAGAIGGLGTSGANNVADMIEDTGTGAAIGAGLGGVTQGVIGGVQAVGGQIVKKIPSTMRAYEKGLKGINTGSENFADSVNKAGKSVVDKVTNVLQGDKVKQADAANVLIKNIDDQIDGIVKNVEKNNEQTAKFLGSVKAERASALEGNKKGLVERLQDQFGQAKKSIGESYDKIESSIPENTTFSVADDVYKLQQDLEFIGGKLPDEANAIVKKFSEAKKIDELNYLELKNLRKTAAKYLESADPGVKKSFSNFSKNLNNTRVNKLSESPLTEDLAQTLLETDKRYAAALDLEENFIGKVNYDKNLKQVYTDRVTKANLPNKEAFATVKNVTKNDSEKLAQYEELLQKLGIVDPKLKKSMQPEFENLIQEDLALKQLDTQVAKPKAVLDQNPDIAKLEATKAQINQPKLIQTKTDELMAGDVNNQKQITDFLTSNLKELDKPTNSTGKQDIEDILATYKKLTGQDISDEALEVVKNTNLVRQSSSEKPIIVGNPINTLQRVSGQVANMTGRTVNKINEGTSTIRNVATDDISNAISNLTKFNTPEASVYANQLAEAAGKGPETRNAVMFGLMQQPGYRAIMNQNKKNEEKEK